ncbi:MAG: hypothetical protein JOY65_04480 [Acetobacteraceae bacterium]|nr:hypothetical protein [Acetobacteraceae bacterium]
MIALALDDTLEHRIEHPAGGEQIIQRRQRPRLQCLDRRLQVGPCRRDQQASAIRQRHEQLQPTVAVHPAGQLKRPALPRMPTTDDPHRRREAIEVGSVSCLPSTRCRGI